MVAGSPPGCAEFLCSTCSLCTLVPPTDQTFMLGSSVDSEVTLNVSESMTSYLSHLSPCVPVMDLMVQCVLCPSHCDCWR